MTASVAQPPVCACNLWTPELAKTPAYLAETSHLLIMTELVIAQRCLHFPEHIAQFLQLHEAHAAVCKSQWAGVVEQASWWPNSSTL
jgi:hypothetical protein